MKPAEPQPRARPAVVAIGLSEADRRRAAHAYFASFRWEPPRIDPTILTASSFLAMLEDVEAP